jgi:hypothetical protein
MSDNAVWRGGGGQPGYYKCSHSGCQKKARNVDNWGRSAELLSGDHLCCGHSKHSTAHAYRARDREEARAAAARADVSEGPVVLLIRSIVRRVLDRRR